MQDDDNVEVIPDELTTLKARADTLGVTYHPSIGLDKLREKVNAAMKDEAPAAKKEVVEDPKEETEGQLRMRLRKEALKLVRVRVTCMNPLKKEWPGEIITCGNTMIGTVKKYVPFNNDEGWHIPAITLEVLRERMFQTFVTVKLPNGGTHRQGKMVKEFAIEVMPNLTQDELDELARRQALGKTVD